MAGAVAGGGPDYGPVNLAVDNDYIAFALPNMGFVTGDVNGDGVVNGTGTGPAATDDVRFFIDHWLAERRVDNILVGDLTSRTTLGDLNFDGRTSLADWSILRAAARSWRRFGFGGIAGRRAGAFHGSNRRLGGRGSLWAGPEDAANLRDAVLIVGIKI